MNHIVITIIKWLFLTIGVVLIAVAAMHSQVFVPFSVLGLVFTCIGGGLIGYGWWIRKKEAYLKQHGFLVQAVFQQVELNEALEVNGSNPFRIVAQWHDARKNEVFIFRSANLWFDPSAFIKSKSIPVYIDLNKPSRYHVDVSFLPKLRG